MQRTTSQTIISGKKIGMYIFATVTLLSIILLCAGKATAADSRGGFRQDGGYSGPGPAVVTVEQAKKMKDDSRVTLEGRIVKHLGGDEYLFEDASGSITVDIDDKRWEGQHYGAHDRVQLQGKVDKGRHDVEIEVKRVLRK